MPLLNFDFIAAKSSCSHLDAFGGVSLCHILLHLLDGISADSWSDNAGKGGDLVFVFFEALLQDNHKSTMSADSRFEPFCTEDKGHDLGNAAVSVTATAIAAPMAITVAIVAAIIFVTTRVTGILSVQQQQTVTAKV